MNDSTLATAHERPRRELTSHTINPANERLRIDVMDQPGSGGACHRYDVSGFNTYSNPSFGVTSACSHDAITILFQHGPILECGVNGLTHEVLLAILIDRLQCFQAGAYGNTYNELALAHSRAALEALLQRTRERLARGVEGTHTV